MSVKIFSFVKVTPNSMVASTKLAQFISDELGFPVCWDGTIADHALDVLIIINGAFAFCPVLAELGQAIEQATRVVWVQQDYTIVPPKSSSSAESPFRAAFRHRAQQGKAPTDFWTTVAPQATPLAPERGPGSAYVNWNVLAMQDLPGRPLAATKDKACYYGSFRENRVKYFDRYFRATRIEVSSPSHKKLTERWPHLVVESKVVDLIPWIQQFRAGLYLEDAKSHGQYHSPGNRFYEMLSAGVPILFQPEARAGMALYGYDTTHYEVFNADHLDETVAKIVDQPAEVQQSWRAEAIRHRRELPAKLHQLWKDYR